MSDFVFFFRATEEERHGAMGTPEQAQKSLAAWRTWVQGLEANGHLKNPGQPLDPSGKVVRGRHKLVTDGPYAETKDLILGYMVVEARDMTEAIALAGECPMVLGGAAVEVRPVMSLPA
jgi:hypothetical protein